MAERRAVQRSIQPCSLGEVELWTIRDPHSNVSATISTLGATITQLLVPDARGALGDVVLGFDSAEEYAADGPYFGAIVGRVANRIAGGSFELQGQQFSLAVNNGPNTLHGGLRGFDKQIWKAEQVEDGVLMSLVSNDGDEGFPGTLHVRACYTLRASTLSLEMTADLVDGKASPVNLAQHTYFNLAGHDSGHLIGDHLVHVCAETYAPIDDTSIPTGDMRAVKDTVMDLTRPAGSLLQPKLDQLALESKNDEPHGFDHNYFLKESATAAPELAARVTHPSSGRILEVLTTAPGVQFYTGNYLEGIRGKGGIPYQRHSGLCLETQHAPSSVSGSNRAAFGGAATPILTPENPTYKHIVVYRFFTEES